MGAAFNRSLFCLMEGLAQRVPSFNVDDAVHGTQKAYFQMQDTGTRTLVSESHVGVVPLSLRNTELLLCNGVQLRASVASCCPDLQSIPSSAALSTCELRDSRQSQ